MRKFLFRLLYVPQVILLLVFLIVRFIPTISPADYQIMGALGLLTPILAIINIVFLFFWVFTKKYAMAITAGVGILVAWNVLSVCFAFNFLKKNDLEKSKQEFTVMSYNVRLLDLYDWTGERNNRKKMLTFIKEKSPDVLCLQEFYTKGGTGLDNIKAIKEAGGYKYAETCAMLEFKNRQWGSAIFSKFPIEKNTNVVINEEAKNLLQEAIINRKGERFKVYNIHLHSNRLANDITWKKDDDMIKTAKKALESSKSIFNKLLLAYKQRGQEANLSAFVIEDNSNDPTIVCGDLNDLPSSYSYFNIKGKLQDAFLERGTGIGPTYNGPISFLRIDYLFHSDQLRLKAFEKIKVPYSDHYPIIGKFEM